MVTEEAGATMLLAQRCRTLGLRVCNFSGMIHRSVNSISDAAMSIEEWHHLGQVAAFLAFAEAGGTPESPDCVDWDSKDLFRRAVSHLQQIAMGSQSDIYDRIKRTRVRLTGSQVAEVQWDAWREASMEDLRRSDLQHAQGLQDAIGLELYPCTETDRYYDFMQRLDNEVPEDALILELTSHLRPQEAVWLIRRYRDGETTATLAREFVQKEARYQTADGFTRAVRYIDVAIHRAKKKAQRLLASHWRQLAVEVS